MNRSQEVKEAICNKVTADAAATLASLNIAELVAEARKSEEGFAKAVMSIKIKITVTDAEQMRIVPSSKLETKKVIDTETEDMIFDLGTDMISKGIGKND